MKLRMWLKAIKRITKWWRNCVRFNSPQIGCIGKPKLSHFGD
jgi:hypothetical protein